MGIWSFLMCKKVQVQGLILNHNYNLCKNSLFFLKKILNIFVFVICCKIYLLGIFRLI